MCIRDRFDELGVAGEPGVPESWAEGAGIEVDVEGALGAGAVSYTHLTLPPSDLV